MKILHIIDSGGLYGAETMLLHLMTEQLHIGLQPILASIGLLSGVEKPIEAEAKLRGLKVCLFHMRPGPNLIGALSILHFARRENVDVLHSHGYKGNILLGFLSQFLRRIPMISTLHGWTSVGGYNRMRFYEWLDSVSLRFVDRVVLVNETMRTHPRLAGLASDNLDVIENGIPLESIRVGGGLRPDIQSFLAEQFTFGAIGRLSSEKGFDILLEAFAGVVAAGNEVQLVILGEGEQRHFLEEKIRSLGLKNRVLLPGFVAEAKNYLPLFDAFVMSSLTEGLPMVLLEAMAAGTPILATRVGGIPKVLEDGLGGKLVDAGDRGSLEMAMISILRGTKLTRERSAWATRRVRESFSSRVMAEKYWQLYLKVTSNKFENERLDGERNTLSD